MMLPCLGEFEYFGRTDPGCRRPANEDAWDAAPEAGLFAVADGMGGHQAGELASACVIRHLMQRRARFAAGGEDPGSLFTEALRQANEEIKALAGRDADKQGMGSTVVAAALQYGELHVAHAGDSRAYLLRGGRLNRLTRDHSFVAGEVSAGRMTEGQARNHSQRHRINRAVGREQVLAVDVRSVPVRPGDRILLCSDGLSDVLTEEQIGAVLLQLETPGGAVDTLVEAAIAGGGPDNITACVIDVKRAAQDTRAPYRPGAASVSRVPWAVAGAVAATLAVLLLATAVAGYFVYKNQAGSGPVVTVQTVETPRDEPAADNPPPVSPPPVSPPPVSPPPVSPPPVSPPPVSPPPVTPPVTSPPATPPPATAPSADTPGTGGRHAELDALLAAVAPLMESLDDSMAGARTDYGQIVAQVQDGNREEDERAAAKFYTPAHQRLQSLIFGDGTRQSPGIFTGLARAADRMADEAEAGADRYARYLPDDLEAARAAHAQAKETAAQADAQLDALTRYAQARALYADLASRVGPLEQAAREAAEKARAAAQEQQEAVLALAEAETLVPQAIQAARERLAAAETYFESGDYPQAAAAYGEVAGLWQAAGTHYQGVIGFRSEALQARTAAEAARKRAQNVSGEANYPEQWRTAQSHFRNGEAAMGDGTFRQARDHFASAEVSYQNIVEVFPELRTDLEKARVEALAQQGKLTAYTRSQSAEDVQAGEQAMEAARGLGAQGTPHVRAALDQYRAAIAHFRAAETRARDKAEALGSRYAQRRAEFADLVPQAELDRADAAHGKGKTALDAGNLDGAVAGFQNALAILESARLAPPEQTPPARAGSTPPVSVIGITVLSPAEDGKTVLAGTQEFKGVVQNSQGNVDRVEYRVNGGEWQRAEVTGEDWRFTATLDPGANTVEVRAADKTGRVSPVVSRGVERRMDSNQVPELTVMEPAADPVELLAPMAMVIRGTARDPEGRLGGVYYRVGSEGPKVSVPITESSWQFSFDATPGTHQLRVWAVDQEEAESDVSNRTIVVREPLEGSDPPEAG